MMIIQLNNTSYSLETMNRLKEVIRKIDQSADSYFEHLYDSNLTDQHIYKALYPFINSKEIEFGKVWEAYKEERLNIFDSQSIEELRLEAIQRFGKDFGTIDTLSNVYSAIVNGEQVYYEIM